MKKRATDKKRRLCYVLTCKWTLLSWNITVHKTRAEAEDAFLAILLARTGTPRTVIPIATLSVVDLALLAEPDRVKLLGRMGTVMVSSADMSCIDSPQQSKKKTLTERLFG